MTKLSVLVAVGVLGCVACSADADGVENAAGLDTLGSDPDPSSAGGDGSVMGTPKNPQLLEGPPPPVDGDDAVMAFAKSGTRLEAVGYASEDASVFWSLRDTELGFDCRFEPSQNGELHCVSKHRRTLYYLDDGCQDPVVAESSVEDRDPFLVTTGDMVIVGGELFRPHDALKTGEMPSHGVSYRVAEMLYAQGASWDNQKTFYSVDQATQRCVANTPRYGRSVPSIYRIEPVSDSRLVQATRRELPLEGGLTLERFVTSDGAEISAGLKWNGQRCVLQANGVCVPAPIAAFGSWFAGCSGTTFYSPGPAPEVPVYGVEKASDGSLRAYALEAACAATNPEGGPGVPGFITGTEAHLFRRGKEITSTLPTLPILSVGTGWLRPAWFSAKLKDSTQRVIVQYSGIDWYESTYAPYDSYMWTRIPTAVGVCTIYWGFEEVACASESDAASQRAAHPLQKVKL